MSSALEQAGAVREPSQYAALSMDRGITGLWTQRSPLRDADVPYLYGKFYSASRFDSLIDGLNREITAKLTYARRAGSSIYNSGLWPAVNSFYSWKRINSGVEVVRVIVDGADNVIYDGTGPSLQKPLFTKSTGIKTRFAGVNTALYFSDGAENKKYLQPDLWSANQTFASSLYSVGELILDSNGNLQYLTTMKVGTVTHVSLANNTVTITFSGTNFFIVPGMTFTLSGLSTATYINNQFLVAKTVSTSGPNFVVTATFPFTPQASVADSGSANTRDVGTIATTSGVQPTWANTVGATTTDGLSTWTCYGTPLFDWGIQGPLPTAPPSLAQLNSFVSYAHVSLVFWQPNTVLGNGTAPLVVVLDENGFIHASGSTVQASGPNYPNFQPPTTVLGVNPFGVVQDGAMSWDTCYWFGSAVSGSVVNLAQGPAAWIALTGPVTAGAPGGDVLVDSNGNLQMVTATGGTNKSGATVPAWNATYGGTTTDGGLTWTNLGPYLAIAFQGDEYGYAFHCIDGSVSTLSPLATLQGGSADGVGGVSAFGSTNPTCDSIWIFRTADGQTTPLFLASIPNPGNNPWTFWDYQTDSALAAEIVGPQAHANDPPPIGMTAPLYHLGRIWAIYKNTVIVSGGPDTLVGNGNTAFPPANAFPIPEQPIRLFPTLTNQGPGVLIWGRSNIYVILGDGTPSNPFKQAALFMAKCGILNYDAVTQIGSTFYAFGNTALVGTHLVGKAYSLDPAAGYVEFGFPIGDQFQFVSTGTGGRIPSGAPFGYLYNPSSTFVTWAELASGDTALYVSDGRVGWFRYSPIASPESGFLWSPRAVITGGCSAVQAIETQPGVTQLLIGPANGTPGPITYRDSAVSLDQGNQFTSYDVKGCIQLCQTGELAEIAHIHLVSMPVGARPFVGILPDEILATQAAPFTWLSPTSPEPPDLKPLQSKSVFSDRYVVMQAGVTGKCMFFQLAMDYGIQGQPDETLLFSIYGAKYAERRQQ